MPGPREAPAIWDYCVIGTTTLPPDGVAGHVSVSGTAQIKSDPKKPSGANGGRNTTQGLDLADLEIELTWNDAPGMWDRVSDAVQSFWPPRGAQGFAHGGTDLINVRDVEIKSVTLPVYNEGKGSLKIKAIEWRPPTPKAIGSGGTAGPNADLLARLAAARAKLAAAKAKNIQDASEIAALEKEVKSLEILAQNANSATKTSTSSTPTKQFAKGNGQGVPLGEVQPNTPPSVPLGEIQP